jgi:hypothetical protein
MADNHKKGRRSGNQNDDDYRTCDRLAKELGVGPATIQRDANFSLAVDKIAKTVGVEAKNKILAGKTGRLSQSLRSIAPLIRSRL